MSPLSDSQKTWPHWGKIRIAQFEPSEWELTCSFSYTFHDNFWHLFLIKLFLFLDHIYRSPIRSASADSYRSDLQCMVIFKKQFGMGMCCFKGCYCLLLLWHLRIIPKESIFLTHWRNSQYLDPGWGRGWNLEPLGAYSLKKNEGIGGCDKPTFRRKRRGWAMKMPWWVEGNNGIVKERQKKWGSDRSYICKYIRVHEEKVIVKDFQLHLRVALSSCSVNIFLLSVWGFHSETGYTGLKGPLCSPGVKAKFSFVFFFR